MQPVRGKVPHFSLKPSPGAIFIFALTLVSGILITLAIYSKEEQDGAYEHRMAFLSIIVTSLLCFFQIILATSKLWFPHLWKKNSSHDRHRHHSPNHPSVQRQRARRPSSRRPEASRRSS
jgi:hypothetical protein